MEIQVSPSLALVLRLESTQRGQMMLTDGSIALKSWLERSIRAAQAVESRALALGECLCRPRGISGRNGRTWRVFPGAKGFIRRLPLALTHLRPYVALPNVDC